MAIEFWENRDKKVLKQGLFLTTAEVAATQVANDSNQNINKPTQLRRFFDEIVSFDAKYKMAVAKASSDEERGIVFKQQLPFLHMLVPKVKYAEARKLISKSFTTVIIESISQIKEPDDIKVFTSFFEAFMGHFKYSLAAKEAAEKESRNYGGKR